MGKYKNKLDALGRNQSSDSEKLVLIDSYDIESIKQFFLDYTKSIRTIIEKSDSRIHDSQIRELQKLDNSINKITDKIDQGIEVSNLKEDKQVQDVIIKNIKDIKIPSTEIPDWIADKKSIKEVHKSLGNIEKAITNQKISFEQSVNDYVPIRRVRKVGNELVFDDSTWGGNGSGGAVAPSVQQVSQSGDWTIQAADSPSIDAFSRWRVSNPSYVFDTNFQYDLQPLVFEAVTTDAETTVTHDSTNRNALMTFNAADSGNAYMQTYEYFRYQAGRSQLILLTFNFIETASNTIKFVGYSDGSNGIELRQTGTAVSIDLLSDTAKGDESVAQASWNLDTMDGTGDSGVTLDLTKTHIFVIDFQWLGVGRIRCGFDVDGVIYYVHEFLHANVQTVAYMQTANLPIRAGMTCSDTATTTMRFICASVASEGGQEDVGGYTMAAEGTGTAASGARTHILSVRPNTTFNSIANRMKFVLESVEILVTGSSPVLWELCIGQAISGTTAFTDVNATYSGFEYNTAGTISGSPALVIAKGYTPATNQSKGTASRALSSKYPITLDAAGAVRANGTLTLIATGVGGDSAMRASFNWREIR